MGESDTSALLALAGLVVTSAGLIVGIIYQLNSRSKTQSDEKHGQHLARWEQHEERFVRSDRRIENNETDITKTRDELHRDYVHEDQLRDFRDEQHKANERQHEANERMFKMLGSLARDLNQMMGELQAKRKSDERD